MPNMIKKVTDQMGFDVIVPENPCRIISLVPSQSELLFQLGLDKEVIGITTFCVHPIDKIKGVAKIGSPKHFNFEVIESLKPDLIIGNKEENYLDGINLLREKYPVWMSDISTLEEALDMITQVGALVNKANPAMIVNIRKGFDELKVNKKGTALYVIWQNPIMVGGRDTFINDMMVRCGFENAAHHLSRYPELSAEQIEEINPDVILLSSEPFPFTEKHARDWQEQYGKKTLLVDGEIFSWYGSRLLDAPDYFKKIDFT